MDGGSEAFEFVFYAELFFFEGCYLDLVPVRVGHLCFDQFLKFLMLVGQFLNMSL